MKNNNIHKILGAITKVGTEGHETFFYNELPALLDGMHEIAIKGYLDQLEEDQPKEDGKKLIVQKLNAPHFTRFYEPCRKAYLSERYKEPPKPESKTVDRVIAGVSVAAAIVFGILSQIRQDKIEKLELQLAGKQDLIDTLSNQANKKDKLIESLKTIKDSTTRK